jgi:3-oxoacyl-(acyl-carrier-protein) synthase
MAVAEGAGMLLLSTIPPAQPIAELLGAGLSCDAYHPAAPHPEGNGAFRAMENALEDSGLQPHDINYINLHGTGTPDNDLAESKAIRKLFRQLPPLSSIKGASGHSLAASGAIEAVISCMAVSHNFLPANTALKNIDPELGLAPLREPLQDHTAPVKAILSNSFGFGGNNGSLVIGATGEFPHNHGGLQPNVLAVQGFSCLSGAGNTTATLEKIKKGQTAAGMAAQETISQDLPPQLIRRLKRLPRLTLALAAAAHQNSGNENPPGSVFMGTGWGALSETYDFLDRLTSSAEQFPSPTDFVGSVHNGPAGQVAMLFHATGPNITCSGGDYSFEQALLSASLTIKDSDRPAILVGADEGHKVFSPLFDPSIAADVPLADGGAALCLSRNREFSKCLISLPFYSNAEQENISDLLLESLGGLEKLQSRTALVLAGIPYAMRDKGEKQFDQFMKRSNLLIPAIRYRNFTGEFASASAIATALAVSFLEDGAIPASFTGREDIILERGRTSILVLGFGEYITAVELYTSTGEPG